MTYWTYILVCYITKCLIFTVFVSLSGHDVAELGIPSFNEYISQYYKLLRMAPEADLSFYMCFVFYRIASIAQGIYKRFLIGVYVNISL